MRRAVVLAGFLALPASAAIVIACGDDETPATTPAPDGPDATDDTFVSPDDSGGGGDSSVDPVCKTAAAPSDSCAASATACERKTLYISPNSTFPFAFVTDATSVYWVAQGGDEDAAHDGTSTASILKVSKTGASTQQAEVLAQNQSRATTLIKDGVDLYWIVSEATDASSSSTLRKLAGATGTPQDVSTFSGIGRRLVRAAPGVFFAVDHQGNVRRLTKDGAVADVGKTSSTPSLAASHDFVFAGGGRYGTVDRAAVSGGAATTFLDLPASSVTDASLPGAHVLGADCERLFGIRDDDGDLFWSTAATAGYTATNEKVTNAQDIVADERFVYVARRLGGGVVRATRDGTGVASVYTGDVWRMAIDDDGIYWGEHDKGAIAGNVFMQTKK